MTGAAAPEGSVIGSTCDTYIQSSNGAIWTKLSGTATNSNWRVGFPVSAQGLGNFVLTGAINSPTYVSQLTGWKIDGQGNGDLRYLYIDELHAKTFVADLEQALAGSQIISKSVTTLALTFTCPDFSAASTLTVDDLPGVPQGEVFQVNDYVLIRNFSRTNNSLDISECIGFVTQPLTPNTGRQSWVFTRAAVGQGGAMIAFATVAPKTLVLDMGISGNGYAETNAIDGAFAQNSPYSQTVTWTGTPSSGNKTVRTRTGNLLGITGVVGEYGLYAAGPTPIGGSPQSSLIASSAIFKALNLDISLYSGITETIRLDHAVPSLAIGSAVPVSFSSGTGIWMGRDSTDGFYKFRAGDPKGNRVQWNGTALQIFGDGGGVTNINGSNIQTGTISADKGTFGSGLNLVRNADCGVTVEDWTPYTNTGLPQLQAVSFPPWNLNGAGCLFTYTGAPAVGTISGVIDAITFPVVVGNKYEASVYLGVQRTGLTTAGIQWQNTVGAVVGTSFGTNCSNGFPGGVSLSAYCRSVVLANAPTGAVNATIFLQTVHTGEATPYVFYVHAFFGEATANQSEASPWGPAGITIITGGVIQTNTITANKINVNSLSAISANLGTVTVGTLNGVTLNGVTINGTVINAGTLNSPNIVIGAGGSLTAGPVTLNSGGMSAPNLSSISANLGSVTAGSINIGGGAFQVQANGITHVDLLSNNSISVSGTISNGPLGGGGTQYVCVGNLGNFFAAASCP